MMVIHECAEAHERLSSLVGCKDLFMVFVMQDVVILFIT